MDIKTNWSVIQEIKLTGAIFSERYSQYLDENLRNVPYMKSDIYNKFQEIDLP